MSEDEDHLGSILSLMIQNMNQMTKLLLVFLQARRSHQQNGETQWSPSSMMKTVPGPSRVAGTCVTGIRSAFGLVMPNSIQETILKMTNLEGRRVLGEKWKELDKMYFHTHLGGLISSWRGSRSQRMNQQPVCGMQRPAGLTILWRETSWQLRGQCGTSGSDNTYYSITQALRSQWMKVAFRGRRPLGIMCLPNQLNTA